MFFNVGRGISPSAIIGGVLIYWISDSFVAAIIGAVLAKYIAAGFAHFVGTIAGVATPGGLQRRQEIFFTATFSALGHLAKADGAVCDREIDFAAGLMAQMQLDENRRREARELFRRGKESDFVLDEVLHNLHRECRGSIGMFMRILVFAAFADGTIGAAEKKALEYIGGRLDISAAELAQILAAARGGAQSQIQQREDDMRDAYLTLGVSENASDGDIKKAYRRLMSRHHPDKMAAKGMPPEMMRIATERAQDISRAYGKIKQARGI